MAKSFDELLKRTTTQQTRERAHRRAQVLLGEMLVTEMQKLSGKRRRKADGAQQSDMQISTLQRIVEALGGELEVIARFPKSARFPKDAVKISQFRKRARRSARPRSATKELQVL